MVKTFFSVRIIKIFFVFFSLFLSLYGYNLKGSDFILSANQDYYNPFVISFNYHMKPLVPLSTGDQLKLVFWIANFHTSKTIAQTETPIGFMSEIYDIYFFLKYDKTNKNFDMSMHIPHNSIETANISFLFPDFLAADIGYEKKVAGSFGSKILLMIISPPHGKIKIGNLHHKSFSYGKSNFKPLAVYIKILKDTVPHKLDDSNSTTDNISTGSICNREKDINILNAEFKKIELDYRAGKATIQELEQAQQRLNNYILKHTKQHEKE